VGPTNDASEYGKRQGASIADRRHESRDHILVGADVVGHGKQLLRIQGMDTSGLSSVESESSSKAIH